MLVTIGAAVVSGCGGSQEGSTIERSADAGKQGTARRPLWGRDFIAIGVSGRAGKRPPIEHASDVGLSLSRQGHRIGWKVRCNGFGGLAHLRGGRIQVSRVAGTQIGCGGRVEREDEWLTQFLEADPEWRLEDDRLVLDGKSGVIELVQSPTEGP